MAFDAHRFKGSRIVWVVDVFEKVKVASTVNSKILKEAVNLVMTLRISGRMFQTLGAPT